MILLMTYFVGLGHFSHVIAGAMEVFQLSWIGERSWVEVLGRYVVPALVGNIIGGVVLVATLNHAQVTADDDTAN
ncbi:MAG: hypothetical protein OHK0029_42700 [Armatimonadaceae bacterium]